MSENNYVAMLVAKDGEIELLKARIAELELQNAYLRSLLPDSDRAKKIAQTAKIRADNEALQAKLQGERVVKRAKG